MCRRASVSCVSFCLSTYALVHCPRLNAPHCRGFNILIRKLPLFYTYSVTSYLSLARHTQGTTPGQNPKTSQFDQLFSNRCKLCSPFIQKSPNLNPSHPKSHSDIDGSQSTITETPINPKVNKSQSRLESKKRGGDAIEGGALAQRTPLCPA